MAAEEQSLVLRPTSAATGVACTRAIQHHLPLPYLDPGQGWRASFSKSSRMSFLNASLRRPVTVVVLVVQDNLVKGASGQAVQCMNLMFGLQESAGLLLAPVLP